MGAKQVEAAARVARVAKVRARTDARSGAAPRTSIVVCVKDGADDVPGLRACLEQLHFPADRLEILLVDNQSRDGTAGLLATWAAEAASGGPRVRALSEAHRPGVAAARNVGLRASTGALLVCTDIDCRPDPDWLASLIEPFADPAVGMVAGRIEALPEPDRVLPTYAARKGILSQEVTLAHPYLPFAQTANFAIRREVLEEVGLFRPALRTGQDADLCWRVQTATAWRFVYAIDAVVKHRHRGSVRGLWRQFRGYGVAHRWLSALHPGAFSLARPKLRRSARRLARWPWRALQCFLRARLHGTRTDRVALVEEPLDVLRAWATWRGTRARLPPDLATIERL